MRSTGNYSYVEDEYDIDHIITKVVDKTREFTTELMSMAKTESDAGKIIRAMIETLAENIK